MSNAEFKNLTKKQIETILEGEQRIRFVRVFKERLAKLAKDANLTINVPLPKNLGPKRDLNALTEDEQDFLTAASLKDQLASGIDGTIFGFSYLGPKTRFVQNVMNLVPPKTDNDGNISPADRAALRHDASFAFSRNIEDENAADEQFLRDLAVDKKSLKAEIKKINSEKKVLKDASILSLPKSFFSNLNKAAAKIASGTFIAGKLGVDNVLTKLSPLIGVKPSLGFGGNRWVVTSDDLKELDAFIVSEEKEDPLEEKTSSVRFGDISPAIEQSINDAFENVIAKLSLMNKNFSTTKRPALLTRRTALGKAQETFVRLVNENFPIEELPSILNSEEIELYRTNLSLYRTNFANAADPIPILGSRANAKILRGASLVDVLDKEQTDAFLENRLDVSDFPSVLPEDPAFNDPEGKKDLDLERIKALEEFKKENEQKQQQESEFEDEDLEEKDPNKKPEVVRSEIPVPQIQPRANALPSAIPDILPIRLRDNQVFELGSNELKRDSVEQIDNLRDFSNFNWQPPPETNIFAPRIDRFELLNPKFLARPLHGFQQIDDRGFGVPIPLIPSQNIAQTRQPIENYRYYDQILQDTGRFQGQPGFRTFQQSVFDRGVNQRLYFPDTIWDRDAPNVRLNA